ncbi:lipoyl synthase [Candidatus Albibeggiatoa sp. nov. BB20]|uniref:lipoyl synthase n=1 Tax=Candidatus Albibeggiatoa sp. nov. BB20 TaxID=3162723 RepID=UPI003365A814
MNKIDPKVGKHQRGQEKTARIPIKIEPSETLLRKPDWIRIKIPNSNQVANLKSKLRKNKLYTVCEEATCPNLNECFSGGTATFMIMGDICTRRCPFCDVAHGRPEPLNQDEPQQLAQTIADMALKYVVITSVDRDDLRDGGAEHFVQCIQAAREAVPTLKIEVLVPDFRGRMEKALEIFKQAAPNVFNHNLETVPRLYKQSRPGADYQWSLDLLKAYKQQHPEVATKSGIMLGLGEEISEVEQVMQDLRDHDCDMLTLGQYLQPSRYHLPVQRYVTPDEFKKLGELGEKMGFRNVASAPLVRSSYHADMQAKTV